MSFKTLRLVPLAMAAMVACASAHAEYSFLDGKLSLSGFGTVGVSRTNTDEALFNYPGQGGGSDRSASFNPDTKLGLQGTYKATNTLSATAQVLTKYRYDGEYKPDFEWAFAKWQALPSLAVRVGRIGAPFFMVSDFRDVGYANTAIRPPLDVYGQVPVSSVDGGDISYQTNLNTTTLTATLWGGQTKAKYASALRNAGADVEPTEIRLRNQIGLNLQAEFDGGYALRVGHMQGKLTVKTSSVAQLTAGLTQLGAFANPVTAPVARELLDALDTTGEKASFTGIGFSVDRDNYVLATEYTMRKVKHGVVSDTTGWYVLGGYRLGSFLPYAVVSRLTVKSANTAMPANVATYLGSTVAGSAQSLMNSDKVAQNTLSAGVRWDFRSGMALKAQFDHINKPSQSNGLFLAPDAATSGNFYNNKKNVNVVSVALDFVF